MPRNGSGTYTRTNSVFNGSTVWTQDKNASNPISALLHDNHDQDVADALTSSIAKDGQTTPTANLPMGGYKHTGVDNGSARNDYAALGQIQDGAVIWAGNSTGSTNVYNLGLSPSITAYTDGMTVMFRSDKINTGSCTLSISGLTAYSIVKGDGSTALVAGDINGNNIYKVTFYSNKFYLHPNLMPTNIGFSSEIRFYTSTTAQWKMDSSGRLISSRTTPEIILSTSDGADNGSISLFAGGAVDTARGAGIIAYGNENANTGKLDLNAGNLSGGDIRFYTQATARLTIDYDGVYSINSTSAGTAGGIVGYWTIVFNGVARKIAIYAT